MKRVCCSTRFEDPARSEWKNKRSNLGFRKKGHPDVAVWILKMGACEGAANQWCIPIYSQWESDPHPPEHVISWLIDLNRVLCSEVEGFNLSCGMFVKLAGDILCMCLWSWQANTLHQVNHGIDRKKKNQEACGIMTDTVWLLKKTFLSEIDPSCAGPRQDHVSHINFVISGSARPGLTSSETKVAENLAFHFIFVLICWEIT